MKVSKSIIVVVCIHGLTYFPHDFVDLPTKEVEFSFGYGQTEYLFWLVEYCGRDSA